MLRASESTSYFLLDVLRVALDDTTREAHPCIRREQQIILLAAIPPAMHDAAPGVPPHSPDIVVAISFPTVTLDLAAPAEANVTAT
jgi:hypothetical protein